MVIQIIFSIYFLLLSWFLTKEQSNYAHAAIRQECLTDSQTNSHFQNGNRPRLYQGVAIVHRLQRSCMDP